MTIELNLHTLDQEPAVPHGPAGGHSTPAAVTRHIAVDRYVLHLGEPCGAMIHDASRAERAAFRPRPTPVLLRPRLIRGLLDRQEELAAALSALDAGLPIEVSGEPGIGKTAVLRHLAHHPRAGSFADGIVYLPARHQSSGDLLQLLFDAFFEYDRICKPTEADIRRSLHDKEALILLDDVELMRDDLEHVLDIAPRSAFAVATRERCLWGEVRSLALTGLPAEDAVSLLEREIERSLDATERSAAASVCAAIAGHPLRILQAAALTREQGLSPDGWARDITPAGLIMHLLASIDKKQRRALLALAALPGVPLHAQHISGIAEVQDLHASLTTLIRRGLVVSHQSRFQLAEGVTDRLRRSEDLKPWANRAITYFTAWAERHQRDPDKLLEESESLLGAQQCAIDTRRWGEALLLGRLLEPLLVVGVRWGAWALTLERCLAAAKAAGDRAAEAWALHEMGTRGVCLCEPGVARRCLNRAVTLREALGDETAAAASRRNLGFVLAPEAAFPRESAAKSIDAALDLDSLRFRDDTERVVGIPNARRGRLLPLAMLLLAAILGGLVNLNAPAAQSWGSSIVTSIGASLRNALAKTGGTTVPEPPLPVTAEPRVLQFSAVPERVAPGDTVRLCYEVADGTGVRIDPDIGEVGVLPRHCVSATPGETTSYTLTARGAAGAPVRQTVLVPVDRPPQAPPSAAPDALASNPEGEPPAGDRPVTAAPQAPRAERASILIFTARPGSIAANGPTALCYAVSGALRVRIEPGLGEVDPATTLTCRRVAPIRTTTYELTAYGRDGREVRQQLVIIVE